MSKIHEEEKHEGEDEEVRVILLKLATERAFVDDEDEEELGKDVVR